MTGKLRRGRPPARGTAADRRFVLRMTDADHARWAAAASPLSLTEFVRKTVERAISRGTR